MIDSHTHIFLWGEDPAKGGYDVNILNAGIALRAARANIRVPPRVRGKASPLSAIWKQKRSRLRRHRNKTSHRRGTIPGPRIFGATRAISTTGGYNLEGYAPNEMPKARNSSMAQSKRARPRASNSTWRGLDQGLYDASLVGGQARKFGLPPTLTVES